MMLRIAKTFKINNTGGQKGFTLVDMLVGLAMASVILFAVVSLFTTMGRSYTTQNVAADVQQVARAGVELMIQEIRMAGFNPIDKPIYKQQFIAISLINAIVFEVFFCIDAVVFGMISDNGP